MNDLASANPLSMVITQATPIDQSPAAVYVAGLGSVNSRRNMGRYLNQIAGLFAENADRFTFQWAALRYQHTQAIRVRLSERYAPATVNGMLSALRGVLKECWRLGQMSAEDYQRAVDFENVKGDTLPAGRDLTAGEIIALSDACFSDTSAAGIRDAAIIGMMYTCGLRRSEIAKLTTADYNSDSGQLKVIKSKGSKSRMVYVTNGAQTALNDWLAIRGSATGALFTRINKGGKISSDGMTGQAIYDMLLKRGNPEKTGIATFTPHDFRRTFVGDLLDRGVDIVTVQKLAGHASPTTTARYDRRPESVKQQAAQKLHFPYKQRKSAE